jgi:hypothetical protein
MFVIFITMKYKIYLFIIFFLNITLTAQNYYQINKDNLSKTVSYLCSEEFSGRLSGHEGYNKAAAYIAEEFYQLGLGKINGSYYQTLFVEYNQIFSPVKFNIIDDGKILREYIAGKDFVCRGFSGSGNLESEIVFCGYGIDEDFYSDYRGVDVKGKIVLIFKPNPSWNIENNAWADGYPRAKSNTAVRNGAAGLIMVSPPNSGNPQKPLASVLHGDGIQQENLPQIHIEIDAANNILENSGYTLSQLQRIIDSTRNPFSFSTGTTADLYVKAEYNKNAETMNIWGLLEGSDPQLKNEFLIIGAHLDHVGKQGDVVFPGANDNASGSAAVLEIARAFIKNNIKPGRSVIFALFASEEQGLIGSKHMADNLPTDTENIIAMLNLDCIGFGDSIQIGNGLSAPVLWNVSRKLDEINGRHMVPDTWKGGGADAGPFHDKGIPALYFVSTNSYEYIHSVEDTPESLDPVLMERITRLAFLTAVEIAEGNYRRETVTK